MPPRWTPDEDATLRTARAQGLSYPAIAALLGRGREGCAHRARRLGCEVPVARWSAEELRAAVTMRKFRRSYATIAATLARRGFPRRDLSQIVAKVRGAWAADRRRFTPWTHPAARLARRLRDEGRTWREVAQALAAAGYPVRTKQGVRKAYRKLIAQES